MNISLKNVSRKAALVTAATSVVVVGAGAVAWGQLAAAIPGADGVIHACYNTAPRQNGALRVIDPAAGQTCNSTYETPLDFNQTGPQGPAGPAGPTGPVGTSDHKRISAEYKHQSLPISAIDTFAAKCPLGMKAFGGGAFVELYQADGTPVGLGEAATYTIPSTESDRWIAKFDQPAVGGATEATVTVVATCATVTP